MGVSKNRGKHPKMDGENNGKPYYIKWMIWGYPFFWKHPYIDNVIEGSVVVQTRKITSNYPCRSDILGFEFLNMKDTLPETNSKSS